MTLPVNQDPKTSFGGLGSSVVLHLGDALGLVV